MDRACATLGQLVLSGRAPRPRTNHASPRPCLRANFVWGGAGIQPVTAPIARAASSEPQRRHGRLDCDHCAPNPPSAPKRPCGNLCNPRTARLSMDARIRRSRRDAARSPSKAARLRQTSPRAARMSRNKSACALKSRPHSTAQVCAIQAAHCPQAQPAYNRRRNRPFIHHGTCAAPIQRTPRRNRGRRVAHRLDIEIKHSFTAASRSFTPIKRTCT